MEKSKEKMSLQKTCACVKVKQEFYSKRTGRFFFLLLRTTGFHNGTVLHPQYKLLSGKRPVYRSILLMSYSLSAYQFSVWYLKSILLKWGFKTEDLVAQVLLIFILSQHWIPAFITILLSLQSRIDVYVGHSPAGTSVQNIIHWHQV